MSKSLFLVALLVGMLSANQAFCSKKFYQGTIELIDGKLLNVLTQIPSHSKDRSIKYKLSQEATSIALAAEKISSIKVQTNKGTKFEFHYAVCLVYNRKDKSFKQKTNKLWLYLDFKTIHMNIYSTSEEFSINKEGKMDLRTSYKFDFYVKKQTEKLFLLAYRYEGQGKKEKYLRECLSEYCKDVPALAKDIAKGVYPWDRLYEIAAVYNWHKEKGK